MQTGTGCGSSSCMTKKILLLAVPLTLSASPTFAKPFMPKVVNVTVNQEGFHPTRVKGKRHQRLKLKFTRTSDKGCATSVVFPELKIKKPLPLNKTVTVVIPTHEARTFSFQCGMGMYKSSVVIR